MTTYVLDGIAVTRNPDTDTVTSVTATQLTVVFRDGQGFINYTVLGQEPGDVLPTVDIGGSEPLSVTIDGVPQPDDTEDSIGFITTPEGTHVLFAIFDPATETDYIFAIGGDPLTLPTTPAEFQTLEGSITDSGEITSGPFAPDQDIQLSTFNDVTVSEDDTIIGTEGNDVVFGGLVGGAGNDTIFGLGGDDRLDGGAGDDTINPGDNTGSGDRIIGSTGDDTFDFVDVVSGFHILDYSGFSSPDNTIAVTIDGAVNTGTVVKGPAGAVGTDTLLDVANPLVAGFSTGGLSILGTTGTDSFDLAPDARQWMVVFGGRGSDSYEISGDGFVRLDFNGFSGGNPFSGIDVNLETGQIANDGFNNAETITGAGNVWEIRATNNDDTITGSAADESFILFGGNDTLDAGLGFDRLRYDQGAVSSLIVDLQAGTATGIANSTAFSHTISGVEFVRGGFGADDLSDSLGDDTFEGRQSADIFRISGGIDTIRDFEIGTDLLDVASPGLDDTQVEAAFAAATDDGSGNAVVDFGNGSTLTFNGLSAAEVQGLDPFSGDPGELINGTEGNDPSLIGTVGDDQIFGFGGSDFIDAGAGDDFINPGDNDGSGDRIRTGTGTDTVDFSDVVTGFHVLEYLPLPGVGITANINGTTNSGTVDKGPNGTDTLINVVNPMVAGFTTGGFSIVGTNDDDVFNLTVDDGQWMSVEGAAGVDTFNISGNGFVRLDFESPVLSRGVDVNLATGEIADDGITSLFPGASLAETVTPGAVWELRATDLDDTIVGSASDESFILRGGNDTLDAGGGFDRLRYDRFGVNGVQVDLAAGTATGDWNGTAFSHSISGVEWVRGSDGDDTLAGDAGDNQLGGRGGIDTFVHVGGNDTIEDFDPSTETLIVRVAGLDQTAVDTAVGAASDTPDGAQVTFGTGTVTFTGLSAADLAGADVQFADPNAANLVQGTDGDDVLNGTAGDDLIVTGDNPGFDTVVGSDGDDTIDFTGITSDPGGFVVVNYSGIGATIDVAIDGGDNTGSVVKTGLGTDTFVNIENPLFAGWATGGLSILGTSGNDTFDVSPEGAQWMSIRPGDGVDTIIVNGSGTQRVSSGDEIGAVRLDFTDATNGVDVNFATRTIADDGFGNTETIGGTAPVWEVLGSAHDDTFVGSDNAESYRSIGGNNTLDGGLGVDRLRYDSFQIASVNIDASAGTATGTLNGGGSFTDTIAGFEWLRGSNGEDQITGEATVDNLFEGGGGIDTFVHVGGNDTIEDFDPSTETLIVRVAGLDQTAVDTAVGAASDTPDGAQVTFGTGTVTFTGLSAADLAGADVQFADPGGQNLVEGTDGDDVLNGTAGDDLIVTGDATPNGDRVVGSAGDDTIDATGMNQSTAALTLDYSGLGAPVTVNIDGAANTGSVDKGASGTDTLVNVENPLIGGANAGGLFVVGTTGDDTFNLAPGADQWMSLRMGEGTDTFSIDGAGSVRLDFVDAANGIDVNLQTGQIANDGFGNAETIGGSSPVWEIRGSSHDDTVQLSDADDSFRKWGGGNDTVDGGGGFNRLRYDSLGVENLSVDLSTGVATGTISGVGFTDAISNFQFVRGSNAASTLTGDDDANRLQGGASGDTLSGGLGDDTLIGGDGGDTFIYTGGNDTILDFQLGLDTIDLAPAGLSDAALSAALSNASEIGGNAFVDFGGGSSLTLNGLTAQEAADLLGGNLLLPPAPPQPSAWTVGDPHLLTIDGVGYDFHAVGEFVLLRGVAGGAVEGFEVQSRMAPVDGVANVSVNAAIAARLGNGSEVMIDATDAQVFSVDGVKQTLNDGDFVDIGNDRVVRQGDTYTIVFAGSDNVLNAGDARVLVNVVNGGQPGARVDIAVQVSDEMRGAVEGLLGDGDGDAANDIARADGTVLERPLAFEDLYGQFRDDWRVTTDEQSLFTYDDGETLDGFYDPNAPGAVTTLDDFEAREVTDAQQAAQDAGLTPGTVNFDNAVLDLLLTGDQSFVEAAADETVAPPPASAPAGALEQGQARAAIEVTVNDLFSGDALEGARVGFAPTGSTALALGTEDADLPGSYNVALGSGVSGRVDATREFTTGDPDIRVGDALDILRMAVGLDTSFGEAQGAHFVAADIDQDGRVGVSDALEALRAAVGLESENAPEWVFFEQDTDFSGVTASNTSVPTGVQVDNVPAEGVNVALDAILLGNIEPLPEVIATT